MVVDGRVGAVAERGLAVCTGFLAGEAQHELRALGEDELAVDGNWAVVHDLGVVAHRLRGLKGGERQDDDGAIIVEPDVLDVLDGVGARCVCGKLAGANRGVGPGGCGGEVGER